MQPFTLFKNISGFHIWAEHREDRLRLLEGIIPSAIHLNCTLQSAEKFEQWLLEEFSDYREMLESENLEVYDACGIYYGQTIIKELKGAWVPCLDDVRSANFGLPAIDESPNLSMRLPPHPCITACLDRRSGQYLSQIIRNHLPHRKTRK